jgi:hypothetical protein
MGPTTLTRNSVLASSYPIGFGGRLLDFGVGGNQRGVDAQIANAEIIQRPLRLHIVERDRRDTHLAERIGFETGLERPYEASNWILRGGMAAFVLPSFGSHFFISHFADLFLQIQLGASSASRGCLIVLCLLEAPFDGLPVNVREECLEILRALRRFVIEQESMLPDV